MPGSQFFLDTKEELFQIFVVHAVIAVPLKMERCAEDKAS